MIGPYRQVQDVLVHTREFYRRLRDMLSTLETAVRDDRTRGVLVAIRREQSAMVLVLGDYVLNGDARILDTWIQYLPDEELARRFDEFQITPDMNPDAVLMRKTAFDEAIVELYRQVSHQSSAPRIREFFERLITQIEQRMKDLGWRFRDSDLAPAQDTAKRRRHETEITRSPSPQS